MKKIIFLIACGMILQSLSATSLEDDVSIRELISTSYINGAFNEQNIDDMKDGFHRDFAIFSSNGNAMERYEIATWISDTKTQKSKQGFNPESVEIMPKLVSLDITGSSAAAKLELYRAGNLIYTDYLLFIKFDDGWKIAGKVYHSH